jgi:uncharacterized repeat protein (TIGR01451 family)
MSKTMEMRRWFKWMAWLACLVSLFVAPRARADSGPPLSVTFSATPDPVAPGEALVYRMKIGNHSPNTPTGPLTVQVNVPQHVKVYSVFDGSCYPYDCRFGSTITWTPPSLAPGETITGHFLASVDNSAEHPPPADGTKLSAELKVSYKQGEVKRTATAIVKKSSPFALAVAPDRGKVEPGGVLTYVISFGNASRATSALKLSAELPAGVTLVSATGGGKGSGKTVEWDLGKVSAGVSERRLLSVKLDKKLAEGTLLPLSAELLDAKNKSQVRAEGIATASTISPIALDLSATSDPVQPGKVVLYKLTISNRSPNTPANAFDVRITIPRHLKVTTGFQGTCYPYDCRFGSILRWNTPALAPGASVIYDFATIVENSQAYPPPPDGALVETEAVAYVHGGVSTSHVGVAPIW